MCRRDLVYYAVFGVFVLLRGLDCTCTDIYPDINSTYVVNMCTDSKVTGKQVFLDTSVARSMSLEPGTICTCYVELQNGHFNLLTNFTATTDSTTCGSYVYIQADEHFSSNISCLTKQAELEFQDRTNLTVEFITTSTVTGDYCVNLGQVLCGDGKFQCTDGTCVQGEACDNIPDCLDRSDEADCGPAPCGETKLRCENGTGCFLPEEKCNGVNDCLDGSDESVKYCENGTAIDDETSTTETPITITCLKLPGATTAAATSTATTWATTTTSKPTTTSSTEETSTKSETTTSKTTPRITSSADPPDTTNVGLIVGIVIGVIAVVIVGVSVWKWRECAKKKKYAVQKKAQKYWNRLHQAHGVHQPTSNQENGHAMQKQIHSSNPNP